MREHEIPFSQEPPLARRSDALVPFDARNTGLFLPKRDGTVLVKKETLASKRNDNAWLQLFGSLPPEDRYPKMVDYLSLAEGMTGQEFQTKNNISPHTILRMKRGETGIDSNTMNKFIKAAPLDEYSLAAQLVRAEAQGQEPLSVHKVPFHTFNTLLSYYQLLYGLSEKEIADIFGVSGTTVDRWQHNIHHPKQFDEERVHERLQASAGDIFAELIIAKGKKRQRVLSMRDRKKLLDGPLLLMEQLERLEPYSLSPEEDMTLQGLKSMASELDKKKSPHILRGVLNVLGERIGTFSNDDIFDVSLHSNSEGKATPIKAARLAKAFGVGLPHPIGVWLVDFVSAENKKPENKKEPVSRREKIIFNPPLAVWLEEVGGKEGIELRLNASGISLREFRDRTGLSAIKLTRILSGKGTEEEFAVVKAIVDKL